MNRLVAACAGMLLAATTATAARAADDAKSLVLDIWPAPALGENGTIGEDPGGVVKRGSDQLAPEICVALGLPPMFFVHANDDRVSPENSVRLYLALKKADVPAELHIDSTGGPGFGLRPSDKPCSTWPDRWVDWLKTLKILDKAS